MYRIVIASHGGLAQELIKSAEMITGEQERIEFVSLKAEYCLNSFKGEIEQKINEKTEEEGLLVLTDIMYGTPFNNVCSLMEKYEFEHFTGVNLPILLECIMSRKHEKIQEVVKRLATEGRSSFVYVNDLLREEGESE